MSRPPAVSRLSTADIVSILGVTRALALPFTLRTMLAEVATVACRILRAERASVWLMDAAQRELFIETSSDLVPVEVRVALGHGLAGQCAETRVPINVPDCYADSRFNPAVDRHSGFHTRCSLSVPMIDQDGELIGVLQVLNKREGAFTATDEPLAEAFAAQCAIALTRVRMTERVIAGELLRQEVVLASEVQRSTLPAALPQIPGYDSHAAFLPASLTGGDTYDLVMLDQGLLIVLADATGHGIGPALSVTRMHAMLRVAFRLGATLESTFRHVNDQLAETLSDGRFVTAFIGLLDPSTHRLRFQSGGQAPILHLEAATGEFAAYRATSFPMGAMPIRTMPATVELELRPGDWLVLLSDGIFECENPDGRPFGREGVAAVFRAHGHRGAREVTDALLAAVRDHRAGAPQDDDITAVVMQRCLPGP